MTNRLDIPDLLRRQAAGVGRAAQRAMAPLRRLAQRVPPPWRVPLLLAGPLAGLGLTSVAGAAWLGGMLGRLLASNPELAGAFRNWHVTQMAAIGRIVMFVMGVVLVAAAGVAMVRRSWVPRVVRAAYVASYVYLAAYVGAVLYAFYAFVSANVPVDDEYLVAWQVFGHKVCALAPAIVAVVACVAGHLFARREIALAHYGASPLPCRELDITVAGSGKDPVFQRTMAASVALHVLIVLLLPLMFSNGQCLRVQDYKIPGGGGGSAAAAEIVVKSMKKAAKRKVFTVRPNSAISFLVPTIDDSTVAKELRDTTEQQYTSTGGYGEGTGKGFGKGSGKGGGWGGGVSDGVVRFIRIQHTGPGWNDGMDLAERSDLNFLEALRDISGFKISQPEAHPMYLLKQYRKGKAPPFVYMTGSGEIGGLTSGDVAALRQYCLEGGMLLGDCGGPVFDRNFADLMRRAFPDREFVDIPNDDPIFRVPFQFPNGAPPLWHHGGDRCKGIKVDGRWCVFYFPGDLKDAWATGNSGLSPALAHQAMQLGMNILYYAFTNYSEMYPQNKPK